MKPTREKAGKVLHLGLPGDGEFPKGLLWTLLSGRQCHSAKREEDEDRH